jgi:hypothetical protein
MIASFVNEHRDAYGVALIRKESPIAPSTYHEHKALERVPERRREQEAQVRGAVGRRLDDRHTARRELAGGTVATT